MQDAHGNAGAKPPKAKLLARLAPVVAVAMVGFAAFILVKALRHYDVSEILRRFHDIPPSRVAAGLGCVVVSYVLQATYDYLALASLGRGASYAKSVFCAFIANAFTNNIGLSLLTGPSIRFRFHSAWGYTPLEIAEVVGMTKLAFFNGLFTMAGLTQVIDPVKLPESWPHVSVRLLGFLCLLPAVVTFIWNGAAHGRTIRLGRLRMTRPAQGVLLLQTVVSGSHLIFAAFTLYFLLPLDALASAGFGGPAGFLASFMAIKFAAMFIPVPGSLGVFEGAAVALLTPALPDYPLLGGLLAYRLLFYLIPFVVALALLVAYELGAKSGTLSRWMRSRKSAAA
jgi:phosphatidylglycerol lysyltransferase